MVRNLRRTLLGLVVLGLSLPGIAWAAQTAVSAIRACPHCPFGCC